MNSGREPARLRKFSPRSGIVSLIFLFLLTLLAYQSYWGNVWYLQDDYYTVNEGGAESIWKAGEKITSWMNNGQGRYQPVRFYLFSLVTHLFPEEYSFFYNFGIHLANVILCFLLLRAFQVAAPTAFTATLLFSVYGVFKMMESPSAIIGGSGLSAFFMLAAIYLLVAGWPSPSPARRYLLLFFSCLSYLGLTFSYEVAFPMLGTIACGLLFFRPLDPGRRLSALQKGAMLLPYLGILVFFYLFFHRPSNYEGAQIHFGPDVFTRFSSYSRVLLHPFLKITLSARKEIFFPFLLYYLAVFWIRKANGPSSRPAQDSARACLFLFLFGLTWYLAAVVLFALNNWMTPTSVMHHHLYLMTIGTTLAILGFLLGVTHLFISPVKKFVFGLLVYGLFPLFLVNSVHFNLRYGEEAAAKTRVLFSVKKQIQQYVPDVQKVDALLLKNFLKPHSLHDYQISHLNGAFLQWFSFQKNLESGDDILSTRDGRITFKGPLSYYDHVLHSKTMNFPDGTLEMLYFDPEKARLLPYGDRIDLAGGINLHQLDQVRGALDRKAKMGPLRAVLRLPPKPGFLTIAFKAPLDRSEIRKHLVLALDDDPVREVYSTKNSIALPHAHLPGRKFLFLDLDFPEAPEMISGIERIDFRESLAGTRLPLKKRGHFDFQKSARRYRVGAAIGFTGDRFAQFINWYDAEPSHRWAKGQSGVISIHFGYLNPKVKRYLLELKGFTLGPQEVKLRINGSPLGLLPRTGPPRWEIPLEAKILKPQAVNQVEFEVPGAKKPGGSDERTLGFAFQEMTFKPLDSP